MWSGEFDIWVRVRIARVCASYLILRKEILSGPLSNWYAAELHDNAQRFFVQAAGGIDCSSVSRR